MLLSGRVDLSYWAEQTHLSCLGTCEQFIFNWVWLHKAKGRIPYGQHVASGREKCCVCLYTMLSISLSVDECRTAALLGVCLCALHICKIPSGYVSL